MYPQQYPQHPQYPPPKKFGGIGCLAWIGIALAVGFLGTLSMCGLIIARAPEANKRAAEEADAAAQRAQEDVIRKADLDATFRKKCKLQPTAPVFPIFSSDFRDRCHDLVRDSLKVPGSGDFPSENDQNLPLTTFDGCTEIYSSYVDAKNAFGVKVRTHYACSYDPRTGLAEVKTTD